MSSENHISLNDANLLHVKYLKTKYAFVNFSQVKWCATCDKFTSLVSPGVLCIEYLLCHIKQDFPYADNV